MLEKSFAIHVDQIGKSFEIYPSPRARLQQFLLSPLRKLAGNSDSSSSNSFKALENITFHIGKGETVGIVGRNGSGKSTLLQIICGTLAPTSGQVRTNGRIAALLELGSGFNPEFSGKENVYLNGQVLGLSLREIDEQYESILQFADIGSFIDHPIKIYSSGMVVRLAFATAIHMKPDILVIDEALAVGDTAFQQKCLSRIRDMQLSGISILLVTHSSNALIDYCDRGIFLKNGKVILDGPCREVVKAYSDELVKDEGGVTSVSGNVTAEPHSNELALVKNYDGVSKPAMQVVSVRLFNENGIESSTYDFADLVRVETVIRVKTSVSKPCFGIQISSTDGIVLWSTTTQSMDTALNDLQEGDHTFTWELQANFSGNRYVLALGLGHIKNGEYKRLHRQDYAAHFDVIPAARQGVGWLAPKPIFSQQSVSAHEGA